MKIIFICHGNICRSPMAESVCSAFAAERGMSDRISVSSAAARTDEIGSPPHRGTVEALARKGIPLIPHRARLLTREDGDKYDLLIGMDDANVRDILRIVGERNAGKVVKLLDFTDSPRPIADPWYTGDFDRTFEDISEGCRALLDRVEAADERGKKIRRT